MSTFCDKSFVVFVSEGKEDTRGDKFHLMAESHRLCEAGIFLSALRTHWVRYLANRGSAHARKSFILPDNAINMLHVPNVVVLF